MILFSSNMICGLDENKILLKKQLEQMIGISKIPNMKGEKIYNYNTNTNDRYKNQFKKINLRISRILNKETGTQFFDPMQSELDSAFHRRYSVENLCLKDQLFKSVSGDLEKNFIIDLSNGLQIVDQNFNADYEVQGEFKPHTLPASLCDFMKRWSSAFTYRLFGFFDSKTNYSKEVKNFSEILNFLRSGENNRKLEDGFNIKLDELLKSAFQLGDAWQQVTESLELKISEKISFIVSDEESYNLKLQIPV